MRVSRAGEITFLATALMIFFAAGTLLRAESISGENAPARLFEIIPSGSQISTPPNAAAGSEKPEEENLFVPIGSQPSSSAENRGTNPPPVMFNLSEAAWPDERIPVESSKLPENERPVLLASRSVYFAVAAEIGHGRWDVVALAPPGRNPALSPPSQAAVNVIGSAAIVLVDELGYSRAAAACLRKAPKSSLRKAPVHKLGRKQRPSGKLNILDVAPGVSFDKARLISEAGIGPEPPGARITEAITLAWWLADVLSKDDPGGADVFYNRAWEFSTRLLKLRALATKRFRDVDTHIVFWATDAYALALAVEVGLPVERWVDRAWLTNPSGSRLREIIDSSPSDRRILVLTTFPVSLGDNPDRWPPLNATLLKKLPLMEITLLPPERMSGGPGSYPKLVAADYDRIFEAATGQTVEEHACRPERITEGE